MKTNFATLFFACIGFSSVAQCTIANHGFESWNSQPIIDFNTSTVIKTYDNPNLNLITLTGLNYWLSPFDVASFMMYDFVPGFNDTMSVYKSNNAHSGNYSLGLQINTTSEMGGITYMMPCSSFSNELKGFVNFSGQAGDSLTVSAVSWASGESMENASSYGFSVITPNGGTWQNFTVNIGPKTDLDTMIIMFNLTSDMGKKSTAKVLIDDLSLAYNDTGVHQEEAETVGIYPNPSNGSFTLKRDKNENCTVSVIDVLGNVVFSEVMNTNSKNYDLSTLEKGMYFVRVSTNEITQNTSLVIQ